MSGAERVQLLMLKGTISEMPPEDQQKVREAKEKLSGVLKDLGETGGIALALIMLETAISEGGSS